MLSSRDEFFDKDIITWREIDGLHSKIVIDIYKSEWKPDFIVGIVRGGAIPGVMISHTMNIPFLPLDIRLRDKLVSNAMGFQHFFDTAVHFTSSQKVLFVDDINDTSDTFKYIDDSMKSNRSNLIFDYKFASLYERVSASIESDYVGKVYTSDDWLVFPWENKYAD